MSYDKVQSATVDKNRIKIRAASSNVFPITYEEAYFDENTPLETQARIFAKGYLDRTLQPNRSATGTCIVAITKALYELAGYYTDNNLIEFNRMLTNSYERLYYDFHLKVTNKKFKYNSILDYKRPEDKILVDQFIELVVDGIVEKNKKPDNVKLRIVQNDSTLGWADSQVGKWGSCRYTSFRDDAKDYPFTQAVFIALGDNRFVID